ncbi:hypothetical protein DFQ04_1666 [Algoriphagus boseongensis]|uniref:Uncharacterized protein n=1 Tax=Algoriphagus boseongensis TaxID=1442587 RepID=A0A4R6T7V4_9BACT|nr:DUF6090 family protein [Algoriphagus boseongensis]TDQ17018.1 hypothetical protein DFQ04_1666 [Algoriphagus boseongensis]
MIQFFRKIRQKLLEQNRVTRYLVYALGEIILVVIGILLALQINTWNQNRQDRKQEQQLLAQLEIEYIKNLDQLNSKIIIREKIINSCLTLLNYRNQDPALINVDSLNFHLYRTITRPTFNPILGVTNEVNSSGKLYLIQNADLRKELTSFESFLEDLTDEEEVIFNFSENLMQPFIIQHYQMGGVVTQFIQDDEFMAMYSLSDRTNEIPLKDLFPPSDFKPILYHPDLEDHLAIMMTNTIYTNQQSIGVKEKIELMLSLIQSGIN